MTTLNLEKKYKGYYTKRAGNIQVIVNKYSKGWEGVIQTYSYTAKDAEGTLVEMFDNITEPFYAPTKKEVCGSIVNWIMSNNI